MKLERDMTSAIPIHLKLSKIAYPVTIVVFTTPRKLLDGFIFLWSNGIHKTTTAFHYIRHFYGHIISFVLII